MTRDISVMIVDDQQLLREGIRTLIELENGLRVAAVAVDGEEALSFYTDLKPDVVLMDIRMPRLDGIEATRRIVRAFPAARILILSTFAEDALLFEALDAGASGYILKDASIDDLASAIRQVHAGNAALEPSLAMKIVQVLRRGSNGGAAGSSAISGPAAGNTISRGLPVKPDTLAKPGISAKPDISLSRRELEVLRLIAQGFSNKEIAERVFLAEGTVKNRVSDILLKIDVRDRTQAALRARELGLL